MPSRERGHTHAQNTLGSSSSTFHARKPWKSPHYISDSCSCACTSRSSSFHADTSGARDTRDTCASSSSDRTEPYAFPFPPYTNGPPRTTLTHTCCLYSFFSFPLHLSHPQHNDRQPNPRRMSASSQPRLAASATVNERVDDVPIDVDDEQGLEAEGWVYVFWYAYSSTMDAYM